ncbi:MAG: CBS domain-containing protein [Xanthobacteraceae bacterium]|nr:CBS domain-containing protein [Xanthobacteraceae bacterium]
MKAAEIMTANVITIRPEASIAEAAELLLTHRISGAPVVDANGQLVGIVSEGDLLRRVEPPPHLAVSRPAPSDAAPGGSRSSPAAIRSRPST